MLSIITVFPDTLFPKPKRYKCFSSQCLLTTLVTDNYFLFYIHYVDDPNDRYSFTDTEQCHMRYNVTFSPVIQIHCNIYTNFPTI